MIKKIKINFIFVWIKETWFTLKYNRVYNDIGGLIAN